MYRTKIQGEVFPKDYKHFNNGVEIAVFSWSNGHLRVLSFESERELRMNTWAIDEIIVVDGVIKTDQLAGKFLPGQHTSLESVQIRSEIGLEIFQFILTRIINNLGKPHHYIVRPVLKKNK